MDRKEAEKLIQGIDRQTIATAKAMTTSLLSAMKGGKWDTVTTANKIVLLVAIAIRYGKGRAENGKETENTDKL